ncbi:MAG: hypothetical protein ABJV04_03415 [Aliiglaciecola sp.]|uniref:hypothetical protein n=1 Tax=Aliiglaciecola sp. TaxID=1872441 RepID=UPI0032996805
MKICKLLLLVTMSCSLIAFQGHAQFSLGSIFGDDEEKDKNTQNQTEDLSDFDVSSPVEQLAKEDISTSKTIGQVVGGIALGYACHKKLGNIPFRSQAIGSCVLLGMKGGVSLGEYVGKAIAVRRLSYATEYEFLESEITASETAIETRQSALEKTQLEIEQTRVRIDQLKAKQSLTAAEIKEAKKLKAETEARLEESLTLKDRYTDTLEYLDSALEESESKISKLESDKEKTQNAYNELLEKRQNLASMLANLQITINELKSDNTVMANLIAG